MSLHKSILTEQSHILEENSIDEIIAKNVKSNGGNVAIKETSASFMLSSLHSYKSALAIGDQATVSEIDAFLLCIEDERKNLEDKVHILSQELSSERNRILRISEDYNNLRKRVEEEQMMAKGEFSPVLNTLHANMLEKFRPILDNFEEAKAKIKVATEGEEKINDIYLTIYKQLVDILGSLDMESESTKPNPVAPLEDSKGKSFSQMEVVKVPCTITVKREKDALDKNIIIQEPYGGRSNGTTSERCFRTTSLSANCAFPSTLTTFAHSRKVNKLQGSTFPVSSNIQEVQGIDNIIAPGTSFLDANASNNIVEGLSFPAATIQVKDEKSEEGRTCLLRNHLCCTSTSDISAVKLEEDVAEEYFDDEIDHIPLKERFNMLASVNAINFGSSQGLNYLKQTLRECDQVYSPSSRSHAAVRWKRKKISVDSNEVDIPDASESNSVDFDKGSQFILKRKKKKTATVSNTVNASGASESDPVGPVKGSQFTLKRTKKKTATDSVETALEEDAPGLLKVLVDRGVQIDEMKLYGNAEDVDESDMFASEDGFSELESVISKIFMQSSNLLKFAPVRLTKKGSQDKYCLGCLVSLIDQTQYLRFKKWPAEWGWCRDLQSFIFVFERHNRIVLERPEYGYATYFFELVLSLPISWQVKRLVTAMKLTSSSRASLIENKSLLVGEDLTEGQALVLEEYGWVRNSGLGTMLRYCGRVVHDRRGETDNAASDWSAKIGKLLMDGYDGGSVVLPNLPRRFESYKQDEVQSIKLEVI